MKIPTEWTFKSSDVAEGFDNHVREQLPWYDLVTDGLRQLARHYIPQNGLVYDIGASTGNMGRALNETLKERNARLVALEESEEMCELYDAPGELVKIDAMDYKFQPFDLGICFLVLMFFPENKRWEFLQELKQQIKPGGALIIVDKCEAHTGYLATALWRISLAGKIAAGVDAESIIEKEISLCGIQRPIDPKLLGDDAIEWFRFGDFAGWIITR